MPTTKSKKPDLTVTTEHTTTEHANAKQLREGFEAFQRGDLDTVRATMTSDCTWTNAGRSPIGGSFTGWDAIAGMFGKLFEMTGGTFSMDVQSILADDRFAVAVYDATSTVNGTTLTSRFVMTDELDRTGKVTSTHTMAYDQEAADAHANG